MAPFDSDVLFPKPRRRYVLIGCVTLVGISIISLFSSTLWSLRPPTYALADSGIESTHLETIPTIVPAQEIDRFASQSYLRGLPTDRFRGLSTAFVSNPKFTSPPR